MNHDADVAIGAIAAAVSRITGLYTKFAQKHGISYGVIQVLYVLNVKNPVTQKQISEICEIPKQTVNSVVNQLKDDKYITLTSSTGDKREKTISLTQLGEAYLKETLSPFFETNKMVVNRVGMDLIRQLSTGLTTLGDTLELEIELKDVSLKWEEKIKKNKGDS